MVSNRQATEAVIAHVRSRPRALGAVVFGTALAVPFAASAAWAAPICACGGAPSSAPAPEPPTPDVRGMSADAAERWIESAAEPATPAHPPAPAPPTSLPEPPPAEPPPPRARARTGAPAHHDDDRAARGAADGDLIAGAAA